LGVAIGGGAGGVEAGLDDFKRHAGPLMRVRYRARCGAQAVDII
jgi:hypothetical protein